MLISRARLSTSCKEGNSYTTIDRFLSSREEANLRFHKEFSRKTRRATRSQVTSLSSTKSLRKRDLSKLPETSIDRESMTRFSLFQTRPKLRLTSSRRERKARDERLRRVREESSTWFLEQLRWSKWEKRILSELLFNLLIFTLSFLSSSYYYFELPFGFEPAVLESGLFRKVPQARKQ